MKTQNHQTFNCIAETKKGNFEVIIKVWEQISDEKNWFGTISWKEEGYVLINGEKLKINEIYSTKIRSYEVAEKFGMSGIATLMCDCSEVVNFKNQIDNERIRKYAEADEEAAISEMIHNL